MARGITEMEFEFDKPDREIDPDMILTIILGSFATFLVLSGLAVCWLEIMF